MTDPGVSLEIPVAASDPDGDPVALSVTPLPDGASFVDAGDGTGLFAWTPGATQLGNFEVTFEAQDAGVPPATDSEPVTISAGAINAPPVLASIGSRSLSACARDAGSGAYQPCRWALPVAQRDALSAMIPTPWEAAGRGFFSRTAQDSG